MITHNVVKYMQTDIFQVRLLLTVYFSGEVSLWSTNKSSFFITVKGTNCVISATAAS